MKLNMRERGDQVRTILAGNPVRDAMATIVGRYPGYGDLPRFFKAVAQAVGISETMARDVWRGTDINCGHRAVLAVKREAARIKREKELLA